MSSATNPEPDPAGPANNNLVIYVGQDIAGHWLVQDSNRNLEGRFTSRGAAMSFARAERQTYHAEVALASAPMTPLIPFLPVGRDERALPRAA